MIEGINLLISIFIGCIVFKCREKYMIVRL